MRTLFLPMPGFFPKRHRTFIQALAANFNLILHDAVMWNISGKNITSTEHIAREIGNVEKLDEFAAHWNAYREFVASTMEDVLGRKASREHLEAHFSQAKPLLSESLKRALVLSEIRLTRPVDMVVSGADYIHYNRPFTFMAARLGIPSVHIEHGLLGLTPYPEDAQNAPHIKFASNYVILDNALEVDIFSKFRRQDNVQQLLPLGTPLDNSVATGNMDVKQAKQLFQVPPWKKCVTVLLSWSEPVTPYAPVTLQRKEVEFVRLIFRAWQRSAVRDRVHLILKCHPAVVDFGQYDNYKKFFRFLAYSHGATSNLTITEGALDEAMSASDLLVSWRRSSVLWDAMMKGRQTALWIPWTKPQTPDSLAPPYPSIAVVDAGLCQFVTDADELAEMFTNMFDEKAPVQFAERIEQFQNKWHLVPGTAEEKSNRIVEWIKNRLQ